MKMCNVMDQLVNAGVLAKTAKNYLRQDLKIKSNALTKVREKNVATSLSISLLMLFWIIYQRI